MLASGYLNRRPKGDQGDKHHMSQEERVR